MGDRYVMGEKVKMRSLSHPRSLSEVSSVCLLALKHLVSLQARTRPSVQAELDLNTTADKKNRIALPPSLSMTLSLEIHGLELESSDDESCQVREASLNQ